MIIQLEFHATYFESIYATRAAMEMKAIAQAIRRGAELAGDVDYLARRYVLGNESDAMGLMQDIVMTVERDKAAVDENSVAETMQSSPI